MESTPICGQLLGILRHHCRGSAYLLRPQRVRAKQGGTKRVYCCDLIKVWHRVQSGAVAFGVPKIRFHDLRHGFANILLNNGVSAEKAAKWLGHAATRMVHKAYGHVLAYDGEMNRLSMREAAA